MKYAAFILRCVKRRHPSGAPLIKEAAFECRGNVLSILVQQDIAPKFLVQSGVDKYIEQLIDNVFVTKVHVTFQAVKLREEQLEEIRRRRKQEDEEAVAEMIKEQKEQVIAKEQQAVKEKPKAVLGRPVTQEPMEIRELTEEATKIVICGEVLTAETRELRGGEMQLLSFAITDYTNTIKCKAFLRYKPRRGRFGGAAAEVLILRLKIHIFILCFGKFFLQLFDRINLRSRLFCGFSFFLCLLFFNDLPIGSVDLFLCRNICGVFLFFIFFLHSKMELL
jgi:DNA polymerase III alpha subunit (gram-positive type)